MDFRDVRMSSTVIQLWAATRPGFSNSVTNSSFFLKRNDGIQYSMTMESNFVMFLHSILNWYFFLFKSHYVSSFLVNPDFRFRFKFIESSSESSIG